jgi:FAD synthase
MPETAVSVVAGVDRLERRHGPMFAVIGVFDGIHRGHQYLLHHLIGEARKRGARPGVITFDSHPDEVIVGAAPPLLLDADERIAGLLMTPDAAFGHDRRGTPDSVRELGEHDGFDLVVVPPFEIDGRAVRSSDVRSAIASGDLGRAEELLGRPYSIVASAGEDGLLEIAMPIALPPPGSYRTIGDCIDVPEPRPARLNLGADGALRLEPPFWESTGTRIHVQFVDA